jgi:hypothetical protein
MWNLFWEWKKLAHTFVNRFYFRSLPKSIVLGDGPIQEVQHPKKKKKGLAHHIKKIRLLRNY